jgi:hypothetical protein
MNELPPHGELVLISADGIYYTARFSEKDKSFVSVSEKKPTRFSADHFQIYWTWIAE